MDLYTEKLASKLILGNFKLQIFEAIKKNAISLDIKLIGFSHMLFKYP